MVEEYLRLAGWENVFDHVITGNMVENSKPAPDIFLLAAQHMGITPGECAGVEDSVNGVRSIREAGMLSIMVPDMTPYQQDMATYVDFCIQDLTQIKTVLAPYMEV